jgi:hypothetical protein
MLLFCRRMFLLYVHNSHLYNLKIKKLSFISNFNESLNSESNSKYDQDFDELRIVFISGFTLKYIYI